ncbi:hypothetical protein ACQCVO_02725 [Bacillus infantis]|uniref:hypothetical protein n=1 Tax=Bacillus infantis TaxID=324767 RepID=UPI003CF7496F
MNLIIILFSLIVSAIAAVLTLKRKNNKWLALLIALCLNALLLVAATGVLYFNNEEARVLGIGQTDLLELIFSIPIITWLNFFILEVIKRKGTRTRK